MVSTSGFILSLFTTHPFYHHMIVVFGNHKLPESLSCPQSVLFSGGRLLTQLLAAGLCQTLAESIAGTCGDGTTSIFAGCKCQQIPEIW